MTQIAHAQQRDRLGCERRGQMPANAVCILHIGAAAFEIALVAVKRFADRDWAAHIIGAGLTARQRPRYIDGLPISENVLAVGGFKIVGQPMRLIQSAPSLLVLRTLQVPGPALRRYPKPMPGLIVIQNGFFRTSRRRRAVAVSSLPARGFGIWRGLQLSGKCPQERRGIAWNSVERHEGSRYAPTICCCPRNSTELH